VARHPRSEAGRLMLRAALLALALAAVPALAQEPAAGTIDFVEGDATVENAAGAARLAREGDAVRAGETITTFARAEVHLRMADGGYLSVRENSKLTLTRYAANGDERDECLIDLARGAFRSATGWIGLFHPQAYSIHTATATIGIRGTDHEPMHLLAGDPRGEPGTYEKVNEGLTVLRTPRGEVEVPPNRAAHAHATRAEAPRVLAQVPAFIQPARNEQRFAQRAQASARAADVQRNERRRQRGLPPAKPPAAAPPKPAAAPVKPAAPARPATPPQAAKPVAATQPAPSRPAEKKAEARRAEIEKKGEARRVQVEKKVEARRAEIEKKAEARRTEKKADTRPAEKKGPRRPDKDEKK